MKLTPIHIAGLAALGLACLSMGCHSEHPGVEPETLPSATVRTESVKVAQRVAFEEVVGTVRSRLRGRVEAKIGGRINTLNAALGQVVEQGELLVELDAREIQAKYDRAVALGDQAARDLERFKTLLAQEAVTRAEYDAAEARQRVAAAAVREAETTLGYAKLVAPFDGVITRKLAEVGDMAAPGRALLDMEDPRDLQLVADVPEALVQRVTTGASLTVRVAALEKVFAATVSEVAPASDPGSRTFQAKLDLEPVPGLRSGQFGRVRVPVAETEVLRIPLSALVTRGQLEMVFVVTNEVARMRLVKTGQKSDDAIELVSGVGIGETLVVEGAHELVDGQPVVEKP